MFSHPAMGETKKWLQDKVTYQIQPIRILFREGSVISRPFDPIFVVIVRVSTLFMLRYTTVSSRYESVPKWNNLRSDPIDLRIHMEAILSTRIVRTLSGSRTTIMWRFETRMKNHS